MTATKRCVDNSNPLGRRFVAECPEHGRLSVPVDVETANHLVREHNRRSHPVPLSVVEG